MFKRVDTSIEAYHRMGSLVLSYSFDVQKNPSSDSEDINEVHDDESANEESDDNGDNMDMEIDGEDPEEKTDDLSDSDDDEDQKFFKAMVPLADMLNGDSDLCNVC